MLYWPVDVFYRQGDSKVDLPYSCCLGASSLQYRFLQVVSKKCTHPCEKLKEFQLGYCLDCEVCLGCGSIWFIYDDLERNMHRKMLIRKGSIETAMNDIFNWKEAGE